MNPTIALAMLFVLAAGCRAADRPTMNAEQWIPPPYRLEYVELESIDGGAPAPWKTIEDWNGSHRANERLIYDAAIRVEHPDGSRSEMTTPYFYSDEGFGTLAVLHRGEATEVLEPPTVLLVPEPRIGAHWETEDEREVTRCTLVRTNLCSDGVASECRIGAHRSESFRRMHFCPGLGMLAREERVRRLSGGTVIERWTTRFVRDGKVLVRDRPRPSFPAP